jgi:hypothetical protein
VNQARHSGDIPFSKIAGLLKKQSCSYQVTHKRLIVGHVKIRICAKFRVNQARHSRDTGVANIKSCKKGAKSAKKNYIINNVVKRQLPFINTLKISNVSLYD